MKRSMHVVGLMPLALGGVLWAGVAQAQNLESVVKEGEGKLVEAQKSQERIDSIVDAQQSKLITYRALLKQVEGLEQYNEQLSTQIEGQQALITRFDDSIKQVATIERQMLPLILRMADALSEYVELDKPVEGRYRCRRKVPAGHRGLSDRDRVRSQDRHLSTDYPARRRRPRGGCAAVWARCARGAEQGHPHDGGLEFGF